MTGKSGKGTARQTVRVDEDLWSTFGRLTTAAGDDRSSVIRAFIRWYNGDPAAVLPSRPCAATTPALDNDTVCPASPDGRHVKSTVAGRNRCQFCGRPM